MRLIGRGLCRFGAHGTRAHFFSVDGKNWISGINKNAMKANQIPQHSTIIAFLKSKGWLEQSRDQHVCVMTPPVSLSLSKGFEYQVPLNDTLIDYREYAIRLVFSIAELYALNKWDLLELLSQRIEDIQKDIQLRKELVAHAI